MIKNDKSDNDNIIRLKNSIALNNNVLRVWTLGITPKEERTRENYTRKCLQGRGHSVIN